MLVLQFLFESVPCLPFYVQLLSEVVDDGLRAHAIFRSSVNTVFLELVVEVFHNILQALFFFGSLLTAVFLELVVDDLRDIL